MKKSKFRVVWELGVDSAYLEIVAFKIEIEYNIKRNNGTDFKIHLNDSKGVIYIPHGGDVKVYKYQKDNLNLIFPFN